MQDENETIEGADRYTSLDPAQQNTGDVYKMLIGSIVPRPIAFVSSVDQQGSFNLAPFSFFTGVSSNPPTLLFVASTRKKGDPATGGDGKKDTLRNVEATGEFVVNIVSETIAAQMNQCAAEVPPGESEFTLSGLTPLASELVKPPRVAESPIHMECRLWKTVATGEEPGSSTVVFGRIVRIHIAQGLMDDHFHIDPVKLAAVGRMAGSTFVYTHDLFQMIRP